MNKKEREKIVKRHYEIIEKEKKFMKETLKLSASQRAIALEIWKSKMKSCL